MKIFKKKTLSLVLSMFSFAGLLFAAEGATGVERYALYIGSNIGGQNNQTLLYANSDAYSLKKAMAEIGGVSEEDSILLYEPTKKDVDNALRQISENILSNKDTTRRSEFLFYYSGHSDEEALILGKNRYEYSELKASISNVPSDVHVVILDSCYSGNFIRAKGGQMKKSFLVDDSSVVKGHAYLSSSSSLEVSQESDEIGSSFFTNAIITGLRGAADTSGDKKVSLNELYTYAFNETLVKTEESSEGPQHPNYNITLVGSGDLILSDVSASDSYIMIPKELEGKFILKDRNGKLVSEINKTGSTPICLAIESGTYTATLITEYETLSNTIIINPSSTFVLGSNELKKVTRVTNRNRGGYFYYDAEEMEEDLEEDYKKEPRKQYDAFHITVFGLENAEKNTNCGFSLGLIGSIEGTISFGQVSSIYNISGNLSGIQTAGVFGIAENVQGIQASGVFNIAEDVQGIQTAGVFDIAENVKGIQASGVFNISEDVQGIQAAGVFNVAEDVQGIQAAGVFNVAEDVQGVQIGLINVCDDCDGVMIGLLNFCENGLCDLGLSKNSQDMVTWSFKSGTNMLYSDFQYSTKAKYFNWFESKDKDDYYYSWNFGLGHRTKLGILFVDWEILSKQYVIKGIEASKLQKEIIEKSDLKLTVGTGSVPLLNSVIVPSLKVDAGLKIGRVSLFGGFALDVEIKDWNESVFRFENRTYNWNVSEYVNLYPSYEFGIAIKL